MSEENTSKRKKRIYKYFLDPTYERSKVDPRTDKRWRNMLSTTDINNELGDNTPTYKDLSDDASFSLLHNECSNQFDDVPSTSDTIFPLEDGYSEDSSTSIPGCYKDSDSNTSNIFSENSDYDNLSSERNETIMFEVAGLTISDVLMMITGICFRYNLSNSAKQAIIKLVKILAGPKFAAWNINSYSMLQQCSPPDDKILYTFYCSKCYVELMEPITKKYFQNQTRFCNTCNNQYKLSMQSPNYFISIDISYQIKMLLEDKDILLKLLANLDLIHNSTNSENTSVRDIYDGELYKKLHDIKCSEFKTLTFNFNTGAALFHSSKLSIWPVQLIINEFPAELRFKTVLLAALWSSDSEPKPAFMNLYLSALVKSAKNLLQSGITIISQNKSIKFKFISLCSSVDSVARPIMQNRMQYNAFQGCSWCYAYGRYVKGAMRYPMSKEDPELRSHESHQKDIHEATELQKMIRGVKGESELIKMPLFDNIWGYPVDCMHGILLGVTRQIWDIWTTPGHKFSLTAKKRLIINNRLLTIKPPHEIHRIPRSLMSKAKWKATEWRSWLLFYSYPCLHGILNIYLQSFLLLVQSTYILLKTDISEENLLQCELDLVRFVGECEILYGEEAITFNMHSLLHLVQSVRKSGPLWATSTFPYESNMFYLKQYVNGPKGVRNQIIDKHLRLMKYRHSVAITAFSTNDSWSSGSGTGRVTGVHEAVRKIEARIGGVESWRGRE